MPHTKTDYNLNDAIAGARNVYTKLTGGTVANDALFYGVIDVLGYGGTYIPAGGTPEAAKKKPAKKLTQAEAKKKLLKELAPLAEQGDNTEAALQFDWKTIAALILQILPYLLPLLG